MDKCSHNGYVYKYRGLLGCTNCGIVLGPKSKKNASILNINNVYISASVKRMLSSISLEVFLKNFEMNQIS